MPPTRRRRLATGLLVSALTTAACLALVEVGLRLWWDNAPYGLYCDASPWEGNGTPLPNATGHDFLGAWQQNSRGYRGPEYEVDHPGRLRAAVVGDSFIYGIGMSEEDTLPGQLEQRLRLAVPDAEVVNAGYPGLELVREAKRVKKVVDDYHPDVVVLVVIYNDIELADSGSAPVPTSRLSLQYTQDWLGKLGDLVLPRVKAGRDAGRSVRLRYALARHWRTWAYAGLELGRIGTHYAEVPRKYSILHQDSQFIEEVVWGRITHMLSDLNDWCGERHSRLVVGIYLDGPIEGVPALAWRRAMGDAGVPTVDLSALWGDYESYTRDWSLRYDGHPNRRAHRVAAETIASWLAVEGITPTPATDEDRQQVEHYEEQVAAWRETNEALAARQRAEIAELREGFGSSVSVDSSGLGISSDDQWLYGWEADGPWPWMRMMDAGGFYLRAGEGGATDLRVEGKRSSPAVTAAFEVTATCDGLTLGDPQPAGPGDFDLVFPFGDPIPAGKVLECNLRTKNLDQDVPEGEVVSHLGPAQGNVAPNGGLRVTRLSLLAP